VLATYGGKQIEWRAGELLSPRRFPREELDRLQREMGAHAFSAQFLQTPLVADGMIVDFSRLHLVETPPPHADLRYIVLSIDTAVKVGDACDYSVIGVWGYDGQHWCLMHVRQQRLDFVELKAATIMTAQSWKADAVVIEDCHTGVALWGEVRQRVNSAVVLPPKGDKAERLAVATDKLYSGEIRFPRCEPWSDAVFLELRSFPDGHDDIVDMITQFVAWLRTRSMRSLLDLKQHGRPSNPARRAASGRSR
jgi:predicted phage terminase large subunit-like protein